MAKKVSPLFIDYIIIAASFLLLTFYSYVRFVEMPYLGFYFNASNGRIVEVNIDQGSAPLLQADDQILQAGEVTWQAYTGNLRQPLFVDVKPGQTVPLRIQRGDTETTIDWTLPGANWGEVYNRLQLVWLPYVFWLAGSVTLLIIRPRDIRWRLLIALNYLTALWIMTGLISFSKLADSAVLMRVAIWMCLPVYLHLHWVFPQPFRPTTRPWVWNLYLVGLALAILQWFQWIPSFAYLIGYMVAIIGSITLLVLHAIKRPEQRRDLRLLWIAYGAVGLCALFISLVGAIGGFPWFSAISILALPLIPAAYFFTIYRHQLGGLELRANQAIAMVLYVLTLFCGVALILTIVRIWYPETGEWMALNLIVSALIGLGSALAYPRFERFVQYRVLGMPLPPARLLETYSARITTSLERERLVRLLCDELFPSLLIRQAVLFKLDDSAFAPLFQLNTTGVEIPIPQDLPSLLALTQAAKSDGSDPHAQYPWIRLIMPLEVGGNMGGVLLLGRRDPDDFYAASELPILQALMDQTAVALQNITQAEQLHAFFQADIERQEAERFHLARELHDSVLGQMALLSRHIDPSPQGDQLAKAYQASVTQIRELIHGLRPTMLTYGLLAALNELGSDLQAQIAHNANTEPVVTTRLSPVDVRYPPEVELHLFRVAQQACQNAIKHARAHRISIEGTLLPGQVDLRVVDDGVGFPTGVPVDLTELVSNQHYGLAGMHERAALINARLEIHSTPGEGTRMQITWHGENGHS